MDIKNSWLFKSPITHRGLHTFEFPENSLIAFKNSIKNCYTIELDVRIIDDGTLIVFHDEKLIRVTKQDGYVTKLKKSDLENIFLISGDGKNTDQHIPTFREVLDFVAGRVPLLIEIKNQGKVGHLESKVIEELRNYNGEFAIQSFNPYTLEYFKNNAPHIIRGQLSCFFDKNELKGAIKRSALKKLKLNKIAKPDFISYRFTDLPNKYVEKTGLPVLAWTIQNNADMEKIIPFCDNIIFENFIPSFK